MYFSTDIENSPKSKNFSRIGKLYHTGNLVVTNNLNGETLWESFKHPMNYTFLLGMKMDENLSMTVRRHGKMMKTLHLEMSLEEDTTL